MSARSHPRGPLDPIGKRKRFGKYRIRRRIAEGGFARVYEATDTVEGVPVALKIPYANLHGAELLARVKREVRLVAVLDHVNILPLKNAEEIEGHLVIVTPLGDETLADRLTRRLSTRQALDYLGQLLDGLAHAHSQDVIHCDVKPENIILFANGRLRLADFGIAKVGYQTQTMASGTGSIGYIAPEQALGKPALSSDVFSVSLVAYRMLAGQLPTWPYEWPPPGHQRLKKAVSPALIAWIERGMAVDRRKRFEDAERMRDAFERIRRHAIRSGARITRRKRGEIVTSWKTLRLREFKKRFGKVLATKADCPKCKGPVSEVMHHCPWCSHKLKVYRGPTRFPARCNRCGRGKKLDWRFCAWCYGGAVGPESDREYSDSQYQGRCHSPRCDRREQLPFSRYCPWCRAKVRRPSRIEGCKEHCKRCKGGTLTEFWSYCAWCGHAHGRDIRVKSTR